MQQCSIAGCVVVIAACGSVPDPNAYDSTDAGIGDGAGAPQVTIEPPSFDFGLSGIGSATVTRSFTITNEGTVDTVVDSIIPSGADASAFAVLSTTCATLSTGSSCTVDVSLAPDREGALAANLDVLGEGDILASASLAGTGVPTTMSITPSVDSFGQIRIDTVADHTFTVRNNGTVAIATPMPTLDGAPYAIGSSDCSAPLPADGTCTFTVRFAPTTLGSQPATIAVAAGAATANAQLAGTGVADVTITRSGPGTITGAGIECGADCTETVTSSPMMLAAVVPAGARFMGWGGAAAGCGTAPTCATPIASGIVGAAGTFADIPTLTVIVNNSDPPGIPLGLGEVRVTPINQTCAGNVTTGGDAACSFDLLQPSVLLTVVNECSAFSGWTGACAGQGTTCTLSVTANVVTQANFTFVTCQ